MSDRRTAVVNLRAVAALATKLADDVEGGRLWEREFDVAMAQIQKSLREVPSLP